MNDDSNGIVKGHVEATIDGLGLADPLPSDPAVHTTRLDNGLRIWLRRAGRPPGRVTIWLHVGAGSLDEADDERGLAHFLEHLAFRGSVNFPPGELEKKLGAIGVRRGRDHNAFTTLDQTTYALFLPDTRAQTLSLGLQSLADFAFRLSLDPDQIEYERRVIVEEMRAHDDVNARIRKRTRSFLLPGSKALDRLPLGTEKIVMEATAKQLRACYERWYRPERSAIIVVGDLDLDPLPDLVARFFGHWTASGEAPIRHSSRISYHSSVRAAVITEAELVKAQVELATIHPLRHIHTVGQLRDRLVEEIGLWIVNRRLRNIVNTGSLWLHGAGVSRSSLLDVCCRARTLGSGEAADAAAIVQLLVTELHRVAIHGFLKTEMTAANNALLRVAAESADKKQKPATESIASELNRALRDDRVPPSPTQIHELTTALLSHKDAGYAARMFCSLFDPARSSVIISAPQRENVDLPDEKQIIEIVTSVQKQTLEPPEEIDTATSLMPTPPAAGHVLDQQQNSDIEILSATLDNGIRLHLKQMDTERNRIFVTVTLAGGRIQESHANFGITAASALVFSQAATTHLSTIQIRDRLADRSLTGGGSVGEDLITLSFATSTEDLEIVLQLIHLLLSRPRLDPVTFQRWQNHIAYSEEKNRTSVEIHLAQASLELLSGCDPRFSLISGARARAIDLESAQSWLQELVTTAPIEAAIVGDVNRDRALKLALRYLGSLNRRQQYDPGLQTLRRLNVSFKRSSASVDIVSNLPRAAILCGWRAAPWKKIRERRLLHMADRILSGRLRRELREQRGLTYSAESAYSPSRAYPRASMLTVAFYTSPERVDEALSSACKLVDELAANGPSAAELEATRMHFQTIFERLQSRPIYWSRTLADLDYHGSTIEEVTTALDHYLAYTAKEIRAVLERYIIDNNHIRVVCRPRPAVSEKS